MSKIIEELWIFSRGGIPLAEIFNNTQLNQALLGGFLSALKSFSNEISETELSSFSFNNSKFVLVSSLKDQIFLVIKSALKVKEKKIQKMVKVILKIFEEIYDIDDIKNWNGDLTFFDEFKNKIELYFKMAQL